MSDLRTAAQQALEALESLQGGCTDSGDGTFEAITVWCPEVIDALRAALEQPAMRVNALARWAHKEEDPPENDWQRGYEAARRWVREVGLPALEQPATVKDSLTVDPVAYSVGRTLHWHEGRGVSDAQLYAAPPRGE